MRHIRRSDMTPRVEMTPLIDVIFLLLTFFIYGLVMMVRAEVLPVEMAAVGTGEAAAESGPIHAISIDAGGRLFYDREPVDDTQLRSRLAALAEAQRTQTPAPMLFVALAAESQADRAPVLIRLMERLRTSGVERYTIVGQPGSPGPGGDAPARPASPVP